MTTKLLKQPLLTLTAKLAAIGITVQAVVATSPGLV